MLTSEASDLSRGSSTADGTVQTKVPQHAKVWRLDRIQEITVGGGGDFVVWLHDGSSPRLSRGYCDRMLGSAGEYEVRAR